MGILPIWYQVLIPHTNDLYTVVCLQVFLFDINDYVVSSNNFDWIIVICLHTVIWFLIIIITNNNP